MNRTILTLASLLMASPVALAQAGKQPLPKAAKQRLDYAIGNWTSRTESIGRGGVVRSTSSSETERKYVIDGRVVQITGLDKRTGEVFVAWEYYDAKAGKYCLTSISGNGSLTTLKGDLGDVFRWESEGRKRPDGTTYAMRFTHSDMKPDSFTAVGEYTLDGGKTWTVFSRQYLTRTAASGKGDQRKSNRRKVPEPARQPEDEPKPRR